jgi:DNA-binding transcriptional MerR regulator
MKKRHLRTSDIAHAVGIHPNTVRLYEAWGFLPPVPRARNGYRRFSERHLEQVRLVRLALRCTWQGGQIRKTALTVIFRAAANDLRGALEHACQLQQLIDDERERAEAAAETLQHWTDIPPAERSAEYRRIGEVSKLLNVSRDVLRNWERNGLIKVPREAGSGYRRYGTNELRRLSVIRALSGARYSAMSILRMLHYLDEGHRGDVRHVLDTPTPDEDALYATDRWLSTLAEMADTVSVMIVLLKSMIDRFFG